MGYGRSCDYGIMRPAVRTVLGQVSLDMMEAAMAIQMFKNAVIAGQVSADYSAPVNVQDTFLIDAPGNVAACWYVPVDNLPDIAGFSHIEVNPAGRQVSLTIRPNRAALLRIYIYADIA